MVENDRAEILWDFQMQTHERVMVNLQDIVVEDKVDKKAVVSDITVPNDSNIRMKEQEKLGKYQDEKAGVHVRTKNSGPCLYYSCEQHF